MLWLEVPRPGPTTALTYLGDHAFSGDVDPDAYRVTFDGNDGVAQSLRLPMGGMHWYGFRSVSPDATDP